MASGSYRLLYRGVVSKVTSEYSGTLEHSCEQEHFTAGDEKFLVLVMLNLHTIALILGRHAYVYWFGSVRVRRNLYTPWGRRDTRLHAVSTNSLPLHVRRAYTFSFVCARVWDGILRTAERTHASYFRFHPPFGGVFSQTCVMPGFSTCTSECELNVPDATTAYKPRLC